MTTRKTLAKVNREVHGYLLRRLLLRASEQAGLTPPSTAREWVVHCQQLGRVLPALKYLSHYLYRGVISHQNIEDDGDYISFCYREGGGAVNSTAMNF